MRTFGYVSKQDLLSKWIRLGTASGSVWNGSIRSRVNVKPIRTYLGMVQSGTVPV